MNDLSQSPTAPPAAPGVGQGERVRGVDDPEVVRALEQYRAARAAGERPAREELLARFPEVAAELSACLQALEFVQAAAVRLEAPAAPGAEVGPDATLGDYRIVRELGRGGMGVVYEAVQLSLGRPVALKILPLAATLDPRQLQRFKNEAQAAACLHHTNIVPVHAVGCERGVHYYAMQLIPGQTLADVIRQLRELPGGAGVPAGRAGRPAPAALAGPGQPAAETLGPGPHDLPTECPAMTPAFFRAVARLGEQAAEALEHAHQQGVVHRDVKPANLMVDARGALWITDFGLAQVQSDTRLTLTGDLVGTLRYMSPEQALGQKSGVDHRTDVYSLGATLYELLTLGPAFGGGSRDELLRQLAFEEPRPPRRLNRAVPAELETIVLKAMARSPAERYQTAQELADDLRRFLDDRPIRARRPTWAQKLRKFARRHRAVVLTAAVSALLLLLTTAVLSVWALVRVTAERDGKEKEAREAQKAKEEAEKKRAEADAAGREASKQARLALKAIEALVYDAHRLTEDRHDTLELRSALLNRAVAELDRVARSADNAQDIDLTMADARDRLGAIYLTAGEPRKALHQFERFHAVAAALVKARPDNPEARRALGAAHRRLGEVRLRLGETAAARDHYARALEILEGLARSPGPEKTQAWLARRDLAHAHQQLGQVSVHLQDLKAAERHYLEALRLSQAVAAEVPRGHRLYDEFRRDLAIAHSGLGGLNLNQLGKVGAARLHYEKARAYFEAWARAHPGSPEAQRGLLVEHLHLGQVRARAGELTAARSAYEDALRLGRRLAAANPRSALDQRHLVVTYNELLQLDLDLNDPAAARGHAEEAAPLVADLARKDPANAQAARDLARYHHLRGRLHVRLGDKQAADADFRKALELNRRASERDPHSAAARGHLAGSHAELAMFSDLHAGDAGAAREHYLKALKLREELARDPDNPAARRGLAFAYLKLGLLSTRARDPAAAETYYQKAREHLEAVARIDPDNGEARRHLAFVYKTLGGLRLQDDPKAARAYYLQALEPLRALEKLDPKNLAARADMAALRVRLGEVCLRLEGAAAARGHFLEAAERYETLKDDPKDLHTRIPLSISYHNLARFLVDHADPKAGDPARAVRFARRAVGLAPRFGMYQLTLGRALYRAGDARGAIVSLEKTEVGGVDVCVRALFLALAHAAAGNPTEAAEWYGRADRWLAAHREFLGSQPQTAAQLRRLHAEAARALGVAKPEGKGGG
jgi:eukaryotic-like serine/threonine-protein kinase